MDWTITDVLTATYDLERVWFDPHDRSSRVRIVRGTYYVNKDMFSRSPTRPVTRSPGASRAQGSSWGARPSSFSTCSASPPVRAATARASGGSRTLPERSSRNCPRSLMASTQRTAGLPPAQTRHRGPFLAGAIGCNVTALTISEVVAGGKCVSDVKAVRNLRLPLP